MHGTTNPKFVNGVVTKVHTIQDVARIKFRIAVGNWLQYFCNFVKRPTQYLTIVKIMMIMIMMMVVVVSKRIEVWDVQEVVIFLFPFFFNFLFTYPF
jgi:hypothetical protein